MVLHKCHIKMFSIFQKCHFENEDLHAGIILISIKIKEVFLNAFIYG